MRREDLEHLIRAAGAITGSRRIIVIGSQYANTNGYVGLCLDVHDAMIAKYFAGREKDHEFCHALAQSGLVDRIAAKISVHFTGTT